MHNATFIGNSGMVQDIRLPREDKLLNRFQDHLDEQYLYRIYSSRRFCTRYTMGDVRLMGY